MSLSQNDPAGEQSAAAEPFRLGAEPGRRLVPYPEGPPIMSLLATALISFVFLATATWTMFPFLAEFLVLLEALVGTAVLTIISLTILLAERHCRFPGWLPFVASFPVAWGLTLPSALEQGGSLLVWLAFGAMVAGISCAPAAPGWCLPPRRAGKICSSTATAPFRLTPCSGCDWMIEWAAMAIS